MRVFLKQLSGFPPESSAIIAKPELKVARSRVSDRWGTQYWLLGDERRIKSCVKSIIISVKALQAPATLGRPSRRTMVPK
ncbi:hypothetical protein AB4Y38_09405 [Paraburkholderia sp. EG285A]|uniref:hypothetical protein n=1 Tax=Paraburkholderia sp. EG285A TaxID=3237009 RepID=UPI0034D30ECB